MSQPYTFQQWTIRPDMVDALERYVKEGVPVSDFLRNVICNDFVHAMGHADDGNLRNIQAYGAYLYNQMPHSAWGSEKAYKAWIKIHAERRAAERREA